MRQIKNEWLLIRRREIEAIKRQLLEYTYAGSYGGSIDLVKVNNIIDGAIIEITKLQEEVDRLKAEIKSYNTPQEIPQEQPKIKPDNKGKALKR